MLSGAVLHSYCSLFLSHSQQIKTFGMAVVKQGILGHVNGSLSFINGYRRYGVSILRMKRTKDVAVVSESQSIQRASFLMLVQVLRLFYQNLSKSYIFGLKRTKSKWNWLLNINRNQINQYGIVPDNQIQISRGSLVSPLMTSISYQSFLRVISIEWISTPSFTEQNKNDYVNILMVNQTNGDYIFRPKFRRRSAQHVNLILFASWQSGHLISVYIFFTPELSDDDASSTSSLSILIP